MALAFAEIAFTPNVRAQQDRLGSGNYARFLSPERAGSDVLGPEERSFIEARDGFYQASVSETGWPYVQFRGGAPGFLQVLDDRTIAYADLRGNRQYISLGNLSANARISLILMDYVNARRLKIWGQVQVIEKDMDAFRDLSRGAFPPKTERLMVIRVEAFDWNCPQHIPQRFTLEEMEPELSEMRTRLAELTAENDRLRHATANSA